MSFKNHEARLWNWERGLRKKLRWPRVPPLAWIVLIAGVCSLPLYFVPSSNSQVCSQLIQYNSSRSVILATVEAKCASWLYRAEDVFLLTVASMAELLSADTSIAALSYLLLWSQANIKKNNEIEYCLSHRMSSAWLSGEWHSLSTMHFRCSAVTECLFTLECHPVQYYCTMSGCYIYGSKPHLVTWKNKSVYVTNLSNSQTARHLLTPL